MGYVVRGRRKWEGSRDKDGYRTYKLMTLVESQNYADGPALASQAVGLPVSGDVWAFGNDLDLWSFCKEDMEISQVLTDFSPNRFYTITQTFSTKPDEARCKTQQIDDPLLKPQEISIEATKYNEQATYDRFGRPCISSSHELLHGPQLEFDSHRFTVHIEQNVAFPELGVVTYCLDTLNAFPMWGFAGRMIKLSGFSATKSFYGTCLIYWKRKLTFDISRKGWDRDVLDEGTKVLQGHWDRATGAWTLDNIAGGAPNPNNPNHFMQAIDRSNNPMKTIILNGAGLPANQMVAVGRGVPNSWYMCIQNTVAGVTLDSPSNFIKVGAQYAPWNSQVNYAPGDRVNGNPAPGGPGGSFLPTYLIARNPVPAGTSLDNGVYWLSLPINQPIKGYWSSALAYNVGDQVQAPPVLPTVAGYIHIEKYDETDLLTLLHLPTDLEEAIP
jgi:hypothetical protein